MRKTNDRVGCFGEGTDDYIWNGSSRYVAGFVSHKWAGMYDILDKGTTTLMDGSTAGEASSALTL